MKTRVSVSDTFILLEGYEEDDSYIEAEILPCGKVEWLKRTPEGKYFHATSHISEWLEEGK